MDKVYDPGSAQAEQGKTIETVLDRKPTEGGHKPS